MHAALRLIPRCQTEGALLQRPPARLPPPQRGPQSEHPVRPEALHLPRRGLHPAAEQRRDARLPLQRLQRHEEADRHRRIQDFHHQDEGAEEKLEGISIVITGHVYTGLPRFGSLRLGTVRMSPRAKSTW